MYEVDDGIPIPTAPRVQKVIKAKMLFSMSGISKSKAAKIAIKELGHDGFNSYDAAWQYIQRRI